MNPRKNILVTIDSTPFSDEPLTLSLRQPVRLVRGTPLPTGLVTGQEPVHLLAAGGTGGYVYDITEDSNGGLPPGLTFNATTGYITGTPTTVGRFMFHAEVQDSSATVAPGSFSLEIFGRLSYTNREPQVGGIARDYSYRFVVNGATGSVTWELVGGTLPDGLTLETDGLLHGTPSGADGFTYFTVRATDGGSGDMLDIPIRIEIAPIFLSFGEDPNFRPLALAPFTNAPLALSPSGGKPPYRFVWPGIADYPWLHFSATESFFGTPPVEDIGVTNTLLGTCYDAAGYAVGVQFTWTVVFSQQVIQPQKNSSDVGDPGPTKFNLVEGANITITASNDGETATYEIAASGGGGGGGVESVNGVGPDSSGNVDIPTGIDLLRIDLFSGSASTVYGSTTKRVAGGSYFDPTDPVYGLSSGSTATLCMLLESTSGSVAAAGELFQKSGTGSPQIIAATSTTTSTTAALVTADVSAAFTDTSAPGIFVARFWIVTPNGLNQATCTGAWIEVIP